jgi:PAS domain S-box-containing protein
MKTKESKTILLVEDEAITAMAEAKTLERKGFTVLTALSGDKAIETAAGHQDIDLILMDIDLGPGIDGTQAAEIILKNKEIPVLFLSNHTEPEIVDKTEKITSYGYVVKNSGDTVLLASIRMAFKLHDAHRELRKREGDLTKSQKLLSLIFDNTPNAITITDAETNIVIEANKGIEWTGWTSEEIIGNNPQMLMNWVHPDTGNKIREIIDETGKNINYRIEFFKKDGTIAHAMMNSVLIRMDDRPYILTISNDVTKLSVSETLLRRTKEELEMTNEELNATVEELEATNQELHATIVELKETKGNLESLLDENKRTLQALQESEYFLRRSQEIARIGSFILEGPRPGQLNYRWRTSQVMNDIMGIDDSYPTTRESLMNLVVDPAAIMEHIKSQVYEKKGNFNLEYQIKRPRDGEVRWIYGQGETVYDDKGNFLSLLATVQDITERKKAEEELKKFQFTIDQSSETVFWLARDGGLGYVNDEACRSLGYTRDELLGMKIFDIDPVLTRERWDADMERFYAGRKGGSVIFESMHRRKDGTLFPVEVRAQFLWFGEHDLHVSVARDITERKQAEEALQQEKIFTDAVIDSIPGLLYLYDEEGRLRRWSKSHETMTGYSTEELNGMHVLDWFKHDEKNAAAIKAGVERAFHEGHATEEGNLMTKSGKKIPYYFTATLLEIQGKKYFTGIGIDITKQKQAYEALGYALREKEALLQELQHRMKNSLAMITGIIELEAVRTENAGEKTVLNNLKGRIDSLTNLYTMLFQTNMVTEVALDEYIQSIVSSLTASYLDGVNSIRIGLQCDPLTVSVKNATAWGLIVNELLTNALKYAYPGGGTGVIRISLKIAGGEASLSISDNGAGPPPDFNIDRPAGFGLLLVNMLTRQLDGALSFSRGTENVFTIRAPVRS